MSEGRVVFVVRKGEFSRVYLKSPPSFWGRNSFKKNLIWYSLHSEEHYQNIFHLRRENRRQQKNSPSTSEDTQ